MRVRMYTGKKPFYSESEEYPEEVIPSDAHYYQSEDDLASLRDYLSRPQFAGITGAFVVTENGDYARIFVTWSNRPYLITCPYYEVLIKYYS